MKKVNSNVKKVIAAGLIVSLLMPSLGNNNCFASEPCDARILYAQPEKRRANRVPVLTADRRVASKPEFDKTINETKPHGAKVVKVEYITDKRSKKQIAKTAGKVLLAAAAVGATGYLIYKMAGAKNTGEMAPYAAGSTSSTGEIAPYVAEKGTETAICEANSLLTTAKTVAENNSTMAGEIAPYAAEDITPLTKVIARTVIRGNNSMYAEKEAAGKTIWETTKNAGKFTAEAAKSVWSGTKTAGKFTAEGAKSVWSGTKTAGKFTAEAAKSVWSGTKTAGKFTAEGAKSVWSGTKTAGKFTAEAAKLGWAGTKTAGKIAAETAKLGWAGTKTAGKITAETAKLGWAGTKFAYTHKNGLAKCCVGATSAIGTGVVINKAAKEVKKLKTFATKTAQNTKTVITAPYKAVKSIAQIPSELMDGAANVYMDTCKVCNAVRHPINTLKAAWKNSCRKATNSNPKGNARYAVKYLK